MSDTQRTGLDRPEGSQYDDVAVHITAAISFDQLLNEYSNRTSSGTGSTRTASEAIAEVSSSEPSIVLPELTSDQYLEAAPEVSLV